MSEFLRHIRILLGCFALVGALCVVPNVAHANPKYASIVIDAATGEVLRERYADKRLYPASLTKMMTLYLVFEAVERGRLRMDSKLTVSNHAARQPRSKLGVRAGSKITVRDAVHACAVKSANDMAVALAEAVGGSERKFARMMTRKAKALGMSSTVFRNPHGLTNRQQKSTARDMAVLARALVRDFPQFYDIFETKRFRYKGKNLRATNKLLGTYEGADGIKTGYTRASGFNLAASAKRDGNRLIGVVFGGRSGARRNRHMKKLLDEGFERLARLQSERSLAMTPLPRLRPARRGDGDLIAAAPAPEAPTALAAMRSNSDPWLVSQGLMALQQVIPPQSRQVASAEPQRGDWAVQVGAYRKRRQAEDMLEKARALRAPQLMRAYPIVSRRVSGGRAIYRARFTGLGRGQAENACRTLMRRGIDCLALRTGG